MANTTAPSDTSAELTAESQLQSTASNTATSQLQTMAPPEPSENLQNPSQLARESSQQNATTETELPKPLFETTHLAIRHMLPQDAPSMAHAARDPAIARYMTNAFPSPYTREDAVTWIVMNLDSATPSSDPNAGPVIPAVGLNYTITLKEKPGEVIGGVGLKPGSDIQSHTAELGYWIGGDWWGRGFATEVVDGFARWVFAGRGMRGEERVGGGGERRVFTRLWAGVFEGNRASRRVLEKGGFRVEGVLRGHVVKRGEVSDLVLLGFTREDWLEWGADEAMCTVMD